MRSLAFFAFATLATQAHAAPQVVVDIAPLHGLVSEVMGDIAAPVLLLPANADAHSYAMRPADAQALVTADVVFWIGDGLTPWLADPLKTLAVDARHVALLQTKGWTPREMQDDAHDVGNIDPHAWLDPAVAAIWVTHIAQVLADADPDNAATYVANATAFTATLSALQAEISATLAPAAGATLIWPHDAYGYFADAYDLHGVGAIAHGDAADPGPAHIADLRDLVTRGEASCVLTDPEINQRWAQVLTQGTDAQTAAVDPMGLGITVGRGLYRTLMVQLATAIAGCAAD